MLHILDICHICIRASSVLSLRTTILRFSTSTIVAAHKIPSEILINNEKYYNITVIIVIINRTTHRLSTDKSKSILTVLVKKCDDINNVQIRNTIYKKIQ